MARCSMVVCATIGAVLMFGASASAQTSATDQYLRDGATGGSGVAGATDTGTDDSLLDRCRRDRRWRRSERRRPAGGDGQRTADVRTTQALSLTFGADVPDDLPTEIAPPSRWRGSRPARRATIARKTVEDFLDSTLAKGLAARWRRRGDRQGRRRAPPAPGAQTAAILRALTPAP